MSTILTLVGSPRQEGHTRTLLRELVKGAEAKGATVRIFDLNDPAFRGCQGCYHCRSHPDCPVEDPFAPFYGEIDAASGVVFASPIYFAEISGQAKSGLDRLFPMLDGKSLSPRYPGKKFVTILAQGDGDPERFASAHTRLRGFFHAFGWKEADALLCSGVSAAGFAMPQELLQRARGAGEKLAG